MSYIRLDQVELDFVAFLKEVACGDSSIARWNKFVINHYIDSSIEEARVELVRASINDSEQNTLLSHHVMVTAQRLLTKLERT